MIRQPPRSTRTHTRSLHDALPILPQRPPPIFTINWITDYPSPSALYGLLLLPDAASNYGHWTDDEFVELRSEEQPSELQALMRTSYAIFCLKKKINLYLCYSS